MHLMLFETHTPSYIRWDIFLKRDRLLKGVLFPIAHIYVYRTYQITQLPEKWWRCRRRRAKLQRLHETR